MKEKQIKDEIEEQQKDLEYLEEGRVFELPVIPLRGLSIFPFMVLHFDIGREKSISALESAMMSNQLVFLSAQKDAETDLPTHEDFYHVGTIAKIKQMLKLPGDSIRVLVEGISRGVVEETVFEVPYFRCRIHKVKEDQFVELPVKVEALMRTVLDLFEEYLDLSPKLSGDILAAVASIDEPGRLADVITSHLEIKTEDKQQVLEAFAVEDRLDILSKLLIKEIEILNIERDIDVKVRTQINRTQKEYYLREQLRAIQAELGQGGQETEDEVESWLKQLAKLKLPAKIHEKVEKEINRMTKIQPSSPESGVIRTYVEWILSLPWNKASKDSMDLDFAEKILNEDHYGLEKVKDRILEYLAVLSLSNTLKGPILCLVGPPGVGKTSIAKSIARSLNRKFVRMSLGGVRDEAEIRGHRRTYIGAIPGRIMSAIKEAGTNPVFLFDEVDKIGNDFRGDPASALLEVLDPEQNKDFTDHYLEIPFDLSKVMFITTANSTDTIPRPLLDRMEVIYVSGYTEEEKLNIANRYLIPKKIKEHGLKPENLTISESGLRSIINNYTRESGVRNLEREIANVCRKAARAVVKERAAAINARESEGKKLTKKELEGIQVKPIKITTSNIENYLGKKRFRYDVVEGVNEIGVTTGLAWTIVGGDTLFIETTVVNGSGQLVLTGQLGDVMKESAKAGISYIRSRWKELGIAENFYKKYDIHIHIPEGATPKDGPSAGVTMALSVISALTSTPVRKEVAMTGEITLRGRVLPVGGIKEKVLAANRAGIKKVLLPALNMVDLEELPANVRRNLKFVPIETIDEALEHTLLKADKTPKAEKAPKAEKVEKTEKAEKQ